ncbi:hypothetical protein ILUMI_26512 [Ignelater luminosus]|uniref:Uncharacterized protein n=1 Tax=Ignelater luminosus TaxID=2038154 RepID=A0A8K0C3Q1_IGNLU|nr:hypothetical protein ILUMI_26512 [Ignelater luminosus]
MEEIVPSRDTFLTKEEFACEARFAETITQTSTGKFVVKLPLKLTNTQLGTTEEVAISKLLSMERKFLKDSNVKTEYTAFMSEYENLRYMTEVSSDKRPSKNVPPDASQRDLQGIVWRESPEKQIKHYQLNTVTYGMVSSSFLATRCLYQIALENAEQFPIECQVIQSDFYVVTH